MADNCFWKQEYQAVEYCTSDTSGFTYGQGGWHKDLPYALDADEGQFSWFKNTSYGWGNSRWWGNWGGYNSNQFGGGVHGIPAGTHWGDCVVFQIVNAMNSYYDYSYSHWMTASGLADGRADMSYLLIADQSTGTTYSGHAKLSNWTYEYGYSAPIMSYPAHKTYVSKGLTWTRAVLFDTYMPDYNPSSATAPKYRQYAFMWSFDMVPHESGAYYETDTYDDFDSNRNWSGGAFATAANYRELFHPNVYTDVTAPPDVSKGYAPFTASQSGADYFIHEDTMEEWLYWVGHDGAHLDWNYPVGGMGHQYLGLTGIDPESKYYGRIAICYVKTQQQSVQSLNKYGQFWDHTVHTHFCGDRFGYYLSYENSESDYLTGCCDDNGWFHAFFIGYDFSLVDPINGGFPALFYVRPTSKTTWAEPVLMYNGNGVWEQSYSLATVPRGELVNVAREPYGLRCTYNRVAKTINVCLSELAGADAIWDNATSQYVFYTFLPGYRGTVGGGSVTVFTSVDHGSSFQVTAKFNNWESDPNANEYGEYVAPAVAGRSGPSYSDGAGKASIASALDTPDVMLVFGNWGAIWGYRPEYYGVVANNFNFITAVRSNPDLFHSQPSGTFAAISSTGGTSWGMPQVIPGGQRLWWLNTARHLNYTVGDYVYPHYDNFGDSAFPQVAGGPASFTVVLNMDDCDFKDPNKGYDWWEWANLHCHITLQWVRGKGDDPSRDRWDIYHDYKNATRFSKDVTLSASDCTSWLLPDRGTAVENLMRAADVPENDPTYTSLVFEGLGPETSGGHQRVSPYSAPLYACGSPGLVLPNGLRCNLAWEDYNLDYIYPGVAPYSLLFISSTDGENWTARDLIPYTWLLENNPEPSWDSSLESMQLAYDDGALYAMYRLGGPTETGYASRLYISKSTNLGATWTLPQATDMVEYDEPNLGDPANAQYLRGFAVSNGSFVTAHAYKLAGDSEPYYALRIMRSTDMVTWTQIALFNDASPYGSPFNHTNLTALPLFLEKDASGNIHLVFTGYRALGAVSPGFEQLGWALNHCRITPSGAVSIQTLDSGRGLVCSYSPTLALYGDTLYMFYLRDFYTSFGARQADLTFGQRPDVTNLSTSYYSGVRWGPSIGPNYAGNRNSTYTTSYASMSEMLMRVSDDSGVTWSAARSTVPAFATYNRGFIPDRYPALSAVVTASGRIYVVTALYNYDGAFTTKVANDYIDPDYSYVYASDDGGKSWGALPPMVLHDFWHNQIAWQLEGDARYNFGGGGLNDNGFATLMYDCTYTWKLYPNPTSSTGFTFIGLDDYDYTVLFYDYSGTRWSPVQWNPYTEDPVYPSSGYGFYNSKGECIGTYNYYPE